jgi:hypothetical protein
VSPDAPSRDARRHTAAPRPGTKPVGTFLDGGGEDAHEHGEGLEETRREDALVGTSGTHTPGGDRRPEEPAGEFAAGAADVDRESGVD